MTLLTLNFNDSCVVEGDSCIHEHTGNKIRNKTKYNTVLLLLLLLLHVEYFLILTPSCYYF